MKLLINGMKLFKMQEFLKAMCNWLANLTSTCRLILLMPDFLYLLKCFFEESQGIVFNSSYFRWSTFQFLTSRKQKARRFCWLLWFGTVIKSNLHGQSAISRVLPTALFRDIENKERKNEFIVLFIKRTIYEIAKLNRRNFHYTIRAQMVPNFSFKKKIRKNDQHVFIWKSSQICPNDLK